MSGFNQPLTVREVARALRISRFTVYDLIKRGTLPAFRVGNRLRIEPQALASYKQTTGQPASGAAAGRGNQPATASPPSGLMLRGEDGRQHRLSRGELLAQPSTTVTATRLGARTFTQQRYTGALLHELLVSSGLVRPVEAWRGALTRYVLALGADGHQAVIALGEIDPSYGNVPVLVAWEQGGLPLAAGEGPLMLVVPSDHRGGRYVRGLVQLEVHDGARADLAVGMTLTRERAS
jgi:excisionase family DNA binding protein